MRCGGRRWGWEWSRHGERARRGWFRMVGDSSFSCSNRAPTLHIRGKTHYAVPSHRCPCPAARYLFNQHRGRAGYQRLGKSPRLKHPRETLIILDIVAMDPLQQSPDSALSRHALAYRAPARSRPTEARDERHQLPGPICEVGQAEETA